MQISAGEHGVHPPGVVMETSWVTTIASPAPQPSPPQLWRKPGIAHQVSSGTNAPLVSEELTSVPPAPAWGQTLLELSCDSIELR